MSNLEYPPEETKCVICNATTVSTDQGLCDEHKYDEQPVASQASSVEQRIDEILEQHGLWSYEGIAASEMTDGRAKQQLLSLIAEERLDEITTPLVNMEAGDSKYISLNYFRDRAAALQAQIKGVNHE